MKVYTAIATYQISLTESAENGQTEWAEKYNDLLERVLATGPSGSGFDAGTPKIISATPEKIVLETEFHHMNENGYYDGWTRHKVTVKPCFLHEMSIVVSGRDRNGSKEYIGDVFWDWLTSKWGEEPCI